ncbi:MULTISPECIES: hypothetical protein [Methylobacterium]|jgi:hypothetical protein|uniref:Uncharacterized protein n=2 Tax=Methylobacterium TaxID=407 RepID=A0A2R4WRQ1_9HYPH|nr:MULTISPECIES: hypothetical protein [Methylobacterium]AWB24222.1 hypothetical protein DA075_27855 [Methylobacterium currus]NGM35088.1 hypothetical protein [Methylobacterium sp. DB0501]
MTSRHPPVSHIAGVLAAQESRIPSHELAQAIMDRLTREGFAIVPADGDTAAAWKALAELDEVLTLPGTPELVAGFAQQLEIEDDQDLARVCGRVRALLDYGAAP